MSGLFAQQSEGGTGEYLADFLPGQLVSCLYQDQQGFLWAGTQSGLHQYDGVSFRTFSHTATDSFSLSEDIVWTICEDHEGFLWVGTETGLNRFDKRLERFEQVGTLSGKLFQEKITAIYEDTNQRLWVGTEAGLFYVDKNTLDLQPYDEGQLDKQISVNVILEDQAKALWVGTETQGVFKLTASGKALQQYSQDNTGLQSNAINDMLETKTGQFYVATDFGFALFDEEKDRFISQKIAGSQGDTLNRSDIEALAEDARGNLWMGTFDNGLFCYTENQKRLERLAQFSASAGPATNDPINTLWVDRSGLLWIGTLLDGLHAYLSQDKKFERFQFADNSTREVYTIFEDQDLNLWVGTVDGLEVYDSTGTLRNTSQEEVAAIIKDEAGTIWLGTFGGGLQKLAKGASWPPQAVDVVLPNNDFALLTGINSLMHDGQQQLWIGTLDGIVLLDKDENLVGRFKPDPKDSLSLANEEVHVLFLDSKDKVWVGTDEGLAFYDEGFYHLNIPSEVGRMLDESSVYAIEEDASGSFWIATSEGLIQLSVDKREARQILSENEDASMQVYDLIFDTEGDLWVSSKKGLWRVKTAAFGAELSLATYLEQEGELPCDRFNAGAFHQTKDGRLVVGCEDGAVVFRPEEVWQNVYATPVVINSFQIGLEEVDFRDPESALSRHISQTERIVLEPGLYRITLGYAALNFIRPESNRYRYRMDKVDKNWLYDRGNRIAEYPLRSGNYTFRIQASNNDGIWSEVDTRLEIVILRPFTETIWFYLICLVLLVAIVVGFVRFRTRQLEQTQRNLEEKVEERTEEVNKKNEALELTLDELKEAQTQLVEQEKMASLGQLTAGVAHEINNPITFVSGNITPLKRDISEMMEILQGYEEEVKAQGLEVQFNRITQLKDHLDYDFLLEEIKQLLEGISEGAERTAEIVRGLRNFSRLDEDVLKLANVNQGIESTLLLLRSELKDRVDIVKDMPEMPDIMCYPGKLNGVYMNILTNARQAIEGKGKIYITTRHLGNKVTISIRDTGPGMPEEVQKRIFEPFFTTKDVGFGTGLGLSITYGAIEMHKGKIVVKSRMGEGTEFLVELPI